LQQYVANDNFIDQLVCKIVQQSCEKIDCTRAVAATTIKRLLELENVTIPHRELLTEVYCSDDLMWTSASKAFPKLKQLLFEPDLLPFALLGFIVSAGDTVEFTAQQASDALIDFVCEIRLNRPQMDFLLETFTEIFRRHFRQIRVAQPLLHLLDRLLTANCFEFYAGLNEPNPRLQELFELTVKEIPNVTKSLNRVMAEISVCCGMLQFEGRLADDALKTIFKFLLHEFPRIRQAASEQLYQALITYATLDNHSEQVLMILGNTDWFAPVEQLKENVNELAALLRIDDFYV